MYFSSFVFFFFLVSFFFFVCFFFFFFVSYLFFFCFFFVFLFPFVRFKMKLDGLIYLCPEISPFILSKYITVILYCSIFSLTTGQTRDRAVANELNRRSDNQPPSGDRLGDRSRESTSESTWYNGPSTTDSYSRGTRTRRQTTTESWEGTVESMNSRVCADGTVDAISGYRGERVVFKNEVRERKRKVWDSIWSV